MEKFVRIYGAVLGTFGLVMSIWGAKTFFDLMKKEQEAIASSEELKAYLQKELDTHPGWEWSEEHKDALRKMGYSI